MRSNQLALAAWLLIALLILTKSDTDWKDGTG